MGHVLWLLFGWPDGICTGNLISSALWAVPALWHLHRKIDRHLKPQGQVMYGKQP